MKLKNVAQWAQSRPGDFYQQDIDKLVEHWQNTENNEKGYIIDGFKIVRKIGIKI